MELDKELRFANSKCLKLGRLLSEKDDRIKSLEDEINEKSVVFPSTPNDKDAKIRDLEGQNAKFQAQYAELQNKVRAVEQDLFEASQSNETLSDDNDVLRERLRVTQFECQKLENVLSENNVLKEKLQEAQIECHKFENVLREKEDFIKCLESKCSNPELKELIQTLENKVNNLENDKQVLAEKIKNLEVSNSSLKRDNVSLKQLQNKYLNELEKTKAELNESASGNTSLDEHDFSIISHNSFNVSEVNSAEEMMQSSSNEEETKHLQEELVEFKNKFKQLEMENQNEIQLKMKLLNYLEQKELDILQNGNVEDNLNKEDFVERFEHLFVNYKERIKNMSDKYNELLNTNVLKSSEEADDGKQYEEYQRQLGDFQNQTGNLENQIDQLKNQTSNLENQIDQLKNHSVNLEKQIHNYKIHTENLEKEIAECVSQIQNYENEIECLNEQIGSYKKQINNMSLNVSQKETQIDQMKNDYEKQHALLNDKLEKSKQEHKDTWQKSQAILREEEEKVEQLGIELRSARMQLENVIRAKEEEVNQYKLLYDNLDRAKASAESEIEARKIQTEIFQGDFEAERQAREKQQEELLKRRDEVDALKEEVEGLRREIQRITNQNFQNRRQYQGDSQSDLDRSGNNRQSFYGNDEWQRPHSRQGREEIREMPCPKCQQNFPDGESLQIHFMDCIE